MVTVGRRSSAICANAGAARANSGGRHNRAVRLRRERPATQRTPAATPAAEEKNRKSGRAPARDALSAAASRGSDGGAGSSRSFLREAGVTLGSARLGSARLGSARLGSARLGSARLGSARLVKSCKAECCIVKSSFGFPRVFSTQVGGDNTTVRYFQEQLSIPFTETHQPGLRFLNMTMGLLVITSSLFWLNTLFRMNTVPVSGREHVLDDHAHGHRAGMPAGRAEAAEQGSGGRFVAPTSKSSK